MLGNWFSIVVEPFSRDDQNFKMERCFGIKPWHFKANFFFFFFNVTICISVWAGNMQNIIYLIIQNNSNQFSKYLACLQTIHLCLLQKWSGFFLPQHLSTNNLEFISSLVVWCLIT